MVSLCGFVLSCLANSVLSFSARMMLRSKNALSSLASWRRMCLTWRCRICWRVLVDGAIVVSWVSGGSKVVEVVARAE